MKLVDNDLLVKSLFASWFWAKLGGQLVFGVLRNCLYEYRQTSPPIVAVATTAGCRRDRHDRRRSPHG
ncbi:hypothetical protein Y032_0020g188 [Ancylostoma ceylanicum]|uniref:Uncharacterized protein n=1 Tax=Ancylostoma ceylanicum TaxID=53326 RepID=A0A016V0T6_9BILA|nr:hypothetical protein Y032_0020g188 [Ancylostoma ceylanicum]